MPIVLYLTNDLMFTSRVSPLVAQCGGELKVVSSAETLLEEAKSDPAKLVLVDMTVAAPSLATTIDEIREQGSTFIVAYASHVHDSKIEAAQQFADLTLTRGQFDQSIAQIISQHVV